jgi:hypothetical protein
VVILEAEDDDDSWLDNAEVVRDIIAVPRVALRVTPGHPSDVRRSRAGGTCP